MFECPRYSRIWFIARLIYGLFISVWNLLWVWYHTAMMSKWAGQKLLFMISCWFWNLWRCRNSKRCWIYILLTYLWRGNSLVEVICSSRSTRGSSWDSEYYVSLWCSSDHGTSFVSIVVAGYTSHSREIIQISKGRINRSLLVIFQIIIVKVVA